MQITIRVVTEEDRDAVLAVESQSTPNLKYLPMVFDQFLSDPEGDFSVAEMDGEVVGCGKFTVMPDGSAWLEALRVIPRAQGQGIGKAFYARFFEVAEGKGIKTMRMYTGMKNKVSKGLAERNGFTLAGTYRGMSKAAGAESRPLAGRGGDARPGGRGGSGGFGGCGGSGGFSGCGGSASCGCDVNESFRAVTDPIRAVELLMPQKDRWGGFVVMNRTFYRLTPALCEAWAREGKVFEEPSSGSLVALGARFMPKQALHLAAFSGDEGLCLEFATNLARVRGTGRVQCMFPPTATDIQDVLARHGFEQDHSDYLVMEVTRAEAARKEAARTEATLSESQ